MKILHQFDIKKLLTIVLLNAVLSVVFSDTTLKYFQPFSGESSDPRNKHKPALKGFCREQSHHIKREDAFRCDAEGKILDPCFIHPHKKNHTAACIPSPWADMEQNIELHQTLSHSNQATLDMSKAYPWAVVLKKNNIKCLSFHKDGDLIDGMKVRYRCLDQSYLVGHLQRCDPNWSILMYKNGQFSHEKIKLAWF